MAPAGGQEGREIHLVERGEDRRGPLRLHEPLGDPPPQPAHRYALRRLGLGWPRCGGRRCRRRGSRFHWRPGVVRALRLGRTRDGRTGRSGSRLLEMTEHVLLGQSAALPASAKLGRVEGMLGHELAHGRAQRRVDRRRSWRSACPADSVAAGPLFGTALAAPGRRWRALVDARHHGAHVHHRALRLDDRELSRRSGGDLHRCLVGLELEHRLLGFHDVSVLLEPARDGAFRYRFAELRDPHLDRHGRDPPVASDVPATPPRLRAERPARGRFRARSTSACSSDSWIL